MLETTSYYHFTGSNWVIEICDKHDRALIIETIELNEGNSINDAIRTAYRAEKRLADKINFINRHFNTKIDFYRNDDGQIELFVRNFTTNENVFISPCLQETLKSIFNNSEEASIFKGLTEYGNQSLITPLEYYFTH